MKPIQRKRKCLPFAGAQSKPPLFPSQSFDRKRLLRKYASCAGSVVLLSYRSCLFLLSFFSPLLLLLLFLSSATGNKGTHRPVPTTCEARRRCCALTSARQAPCSLGLLAYCARCEKRRPCCVRTGSSGSHPQPARLSFFFSKKKKAEQMCDDRRRRMCERMYVHARPGPAWPWPAGGHICKRAAPMAPHVSGGFR